MKIRTDFVTNSSSSSFVVEVEFSLKNGETLTFVGNGASGESGPIDYFKNEAHVTVSPKQLGNSKNIEELIALLASGITDADWDEQVPIFKKTYVVEDTLGKKRDAHKFVKIMQDKIVSMDNIKAITVSGTKFSGFDMYSKRYTYDLKTKKYTGTIYGQDFESEGCPGKIELSDLKTCKIDHRETLDKWYDGTPDSKLDRLMRLASSTKNKKASVKKYKRYGIRVGFNFVDGEDMVFYDCSSSTSPYAMNFFQDKVKFKVSPKQLGECKTLKAIEKKLIDVVVDFDGKNERKIFEPMDMRPDLSAIKSIEDIDSIFISYKGWDKDESDDFYEATYTYYMDGSFYCGEILNPQYADKVEKVLLELSDLDACEVEETDIANDEDGDEEVEELVKQEKIKKEMEQWQKSVAMITKNRKNEKNKRLKQYDEEYRLSVDKIQRKKDMDVAEIRKRIANLEKSVAQSTEELNRLGIFKFKRREELRMDIESYKKTIQDSMVRILSVENKAQEDISVEEMKCKKKVECLEGELDREFVIPESPEEIERRKMEEKRLRKQIEELSVEEKIVFEALTLCDKPVTVSELWRTNYEVSLLSPSIITARLGCLTEKGIVEKHVEVKTTKFAVVNHYKNLEKRV